MRDIVKEAQAIIDEFILASAETTRKVQMEKHRKRRMKKIVVTCLLLLGLLLFSGAALLIKYLRCPGSFLICRGILNFKKVRRIGTRAHNPYEIRVMGSLYFFCFKQIWYIVTPFEYFVPFFSFQKTG